MTRFDLIIWSMVIGVVVILVLRQNKTVSWLSKTINKDMNLTENKVDVESNIFNIVEKRNILKDNYHEIMEYVSGFANAYKGSASESEFNMLLKVLNSKYGLGVTKENIWNLKSVMVEIEQDRMFEQAYKDGELDNIDSAISFVVKNINDDTFTQIVILSKYLSMYNKPIPDGSFVKLEEYKENQLITSFENKLLSYSRNGTDSFSSMTGIEFEQYLMQVFQNRGYLVETTPVTGDQGADLIVIKDGVKICVQAKKYSATVNNKAVQEVVASLAHYNGDKAVVITTGRFTSGAIELAKSNNVTLVDGEELQNFLNGSNLKL